jgi:monofunctional biosynthetic peptidoglycan transglycosylase
MRRTGKSFGSVLRLLFKVSVAVFLTTILATLSLRWIPPPTSAMMLQSRFNAWRTGDKHYRMHYRWVAWKGISPQMRIAVVAAEDQKFPQHAGFDFASISEALHEHENGRRLRGASTISQQVVKNLFLWPGRSFVRKGLEAYFTVLIESLWSKRRILEVYLNVAEFGKGVYGVGAASEVFFGKSPARLSREEAVLLAAVLPNPLRLSAERPSEYVHERCTWILEQIELLGGPAYLRSL